MTTLTLTPEQSITLHVPATVELLRGWVGPTHDGGGDLIACFGMLSGSPPIWVDVAHRGGYGVHQIDLLRLPLSRPECRHRLIDVLAAGEPCDDCVGTGVCPSLHDERHPCHECDGTLWFRKPVDLSAFRGVKAEGWGPELGAALLYLSWVRMGAGHGPVGVPLTRSPLGAWRARLDGCAWNYYPGTDAELLAEGHALLDITPEGHTLRAEVPNAL